MSSVLNGVTIGGMGIGVLVVGADVPKRLGKPARSCAYGLLLFWLYTFPCYL